MAAVVEVKYFNTFLLKKLSKDDNDFQPVYNGSSGIPENIGGYPIYSDDEDEYDVDDDGNDEYVGDDDDGEGDDGDDDDDDG